MYRVASFKQQTFGQPNTYWYSFRPFYSVRNNAAYLYIYIICSSGWHAWEKCLKGTGQQACPPSAIETNHSILEAEPVYTPTRNPSPVGRDVRLCKLLLRNSKAVVPTGEVTSWVRRRLVTLWSSAPFGTLSFALARFSVGLFSLATKTNHCLWSAAKKDSSVPFD